MDGYWYNSKDKRNSVFHYKDKCWERLLPHINGNYLYCSREPERNVRGSENLIWGEKDIFKCHCEYHIEDIVGDLYATMSHMTSNQYNRAVSLGLDK